MQALVSTQQWVRELGRTLCACFFTLLLVACGGGSGGSNSSPSPASAPGPTQVPAPAPTPQPIGTLQFGAATFSVNESTSVVAISVSRTGGANGAVGATIGVASGGTANSADYTFTSTAVSFADGESGMKMANIAIVNDTADEPNETVNLQIGQPTGGATIGTQATAILTITDDDPTTHRIAGSVLELGGTSLVLQDNGGDDLPISVSGAFSFITPIAEGAAYAVTVKTQPTNPPQRCVVANGQGTMGTSDVTNVSIKCTLLQRVVIRRRAGGAQDDLFVAYEDGTAFATLGNAGEDEYLGGVAVGTDNRIVFQRRSTTVGDVYTIKPDGTSLIPLAASALVEMLGGNGGVGAAITASAKVVFYRVVSSSSNELRIINADGTGELLLTSAYGYLGATNGRIILSKSTTATKTDIFSVKEDGTDLVTLSAAPEYDEYFATTASGRVIFARIFGSQRDLYSINADGTGLATLSASTLSDEFMSVIAINDRVLFYRQPTGGQFDLYSVSANGAGLATLANSPDQESLAAVTPDGRVIFQRQVGGVQSDLFIINADGTGLTAIGTTTAPEYFATLTQTGQIVFIRETAGQFDLYIVNADGTDERRLTDTPALDELSSCGSLCGSATFASTTNNRVVFMRQPVGGGQQDIFSIKSDGSDEIALAVTSDFESLVTVTASGRVIYERLLGGSTTNYDLYSVNDDGSDPRVIANTPDSEFVEAVF